ncbi:hypothetical protein B0T17DRAFT_395966 [Bombardia bombarda]|uniref:Chitin synthase regulatory factor 3 n=1 Tax=Bombardia bombarda TaxID=252184 RepID=A0AA39TIR9_9PEZI|nr:hypothetical protein B0T17DRAFT_395966 [Bombardia bombarda]
MAYNGGYDGGPGGGRPHGGQGGGQWPPPQRQYPPGPGAPPQQQYNAPPQQYEQQYQDEYAYGYDEYGGGNAPGNANGNGYGQGYGGHYDDMNYQRRGGPPPNPDYPPQDYYDPGPNGPPGPGPGRGGRGGRGGGPMMRGRGGPMRPPNFDGARGGPYPPRGGGYPPPQGRGGYPPQSRGGRPGGPPERSASGHSDLSLNRRPTLNGQGPAPGPVSPAGELGLGSGPFPTFPGKTRRSDMEDENQLVDQLNALEMSGQMPSQVPIQRAPGSQRGPMRSSGNGYGGPEPMGPPRGPPQQQNYPDQRRGPPPGPGYGPPMGDYPEGYGPPSRSMTMPAREAMEMRPPVVHPPRSDSAAPYMGRGIPPRPNTAQGMRPPPQRMYPPNNGPPPQDPYMDPGYGNPPDLGYGGQPRPASFDDLYDNYYDARNNNEYAAQNAPLPQQSEAPRFDDMPPQRPRQPGSQELAPHRGPGRLPEMSRTKSQPDLRNSQTAVFEMAGDIPPIPAMPTPNQFPHAVGQRGPPEGQQGFQKPPPGQMGPQMAGPGLPSQPAPYRAPTQPGTPQGGLDALPSHPTPVRPGHMPNSLVNISSRPPPVRNYSGSTVSTPSVATPAGNTPGPSPLQNAGAPSAAAATAAAAAAPPPAKPVEKPVTVDELEHLRAVVKQDSNDQASALRLAKRLIEASDVLVPNLPDPKARARSRDRYIMDAHKILRKLEKASNADAMFFMADCTGRGLFSSDPDNAHAFSLYQSAAKLGHAAAAYRTAVCCEIGNDEGGGTRKDPLKAIQWYKRAATLGDTPAMYKVGMILLKGLLGQPPNQRDAISWLKRAAERADAENPHALHELALLYESAQPNDAIVRDEAYAFQLFKQAADLGYKFSQFRLGCAYEYGLMGCHIDPRQSIMWYSRAATQEEHQSELALSGWYLTGSEGVLAPSDTEAYLWARKAAIAGLAKAEYAMGYFTEIGIGVPANLEDAKRWYWRAAAQDYPMARGRLEDLKRTGKSGGPRARERISRSKIGKQQEGECVVM